MLGLGVRTGYSYKGRGGGHGHPTGLPRLHPALGLCFDMALEHSTPRLVHTPTQLHPPLPALLCPLTSLPSKPHGATALAAAKFSSQVTQDKELLKHPPMPAVLCPLGKGPPTSGSWYQSSAPSAPILLLHGRRDWCRTQRRKGLPQFPGRSLPPEPHVWEWETHHPSGRALLVITV